MNEDLATILRPKTIDEVVGQQHLLGEDKPLRKLIERNKLKSLILYGPPGTGKTTIAEIIAKTAGIKFSKFNATSASVTQIRKVGQKAEKEGRTLVFIDEIHRFSSTQQDVLLPFMESGVLVVVGATTENPFHSIRGALLSRSSIFQVEPLTEKDLLVLVGRAVAYYRKIYPKMKVEQEALKHILRISCGDGRKAINTVELTLETCESLTLADVKEIAPSKYVVFGKDEHFDLASAYQGSIQASDPDAAIYWLAKWLESGEDPRYIARRLLVSASEDAASRPEAATVAHNAYIAAKEIGRPECDIILAHATILVATAPRDKSAARAIWAAVSDVKKGREQFVPKGMKDSHYAGAKALGHGQYHDGADPSAYVGIEKKYYFPR